MPERGFSRACSLSIGRLNGNLRLNVWKSSSCWKQKCLRWRWDFRTAQRWPEWRIRGPARTSFVVSGLKGSFSGHPKWDCGSKYNEGCQPTSNSSFELILALTSRAFRVAVDKTSDRRRVTGANVVRNESHVAVVVDADCFSNAQRQIETSKHDYLDFAFRTREKKFLHPNFFFFGKKCFFISTSFSFETEITEIMIKSGQHVLAKLFLLHSDRRSSFKAVDDTIKILS